MTLGDAMHSVLDLREAAEEVIDLIPKVSLYHDRKQPLYILLNKILKAYFSDSKGETLDVFPYDGMIWPKVSLGNLNSYDYFVMDELVIYAYYWANRDRYKVAFDVGANIGVDSIIMRRAGFEVYSFEPDPYNYGHLVNNIELNELTDIQTFNNAVSDSVRTVEFVSVKGNTNASHIKGERGFYGDVEYMEVETTTFAEVGLLPDLMKINIEGHEKNLVPTIDKADWVKIDTFIEIHDEENSRSIFEFFSEAEMNIFSQKTGWQRVQDMKAMPLSNREGYVFVSKKPAMPWPENA